MRWIESLRSGTPLSEFTQGSVAANFTVDGAAADTLDYDTSLVVQRRGEAKVPLKATRFNRWTGGSRRD